MPFFCRPLPGSAWIAQAFLTAAGVVMFSCDCARALTISRSESPAVETGIASSLAIVGGRPAIVWADSDLKAVKYTRALDADGTAWGPHVTVEAREGIGRYVKMTVANGNPAVCYADETERKVRFVRALWDPLESTCRHASLSIL